MIAALAVHTWPARRYLLFYVMPLAALLPWWMRERLAVSRILTATQRRVDIGIVAVSAIRALFGPVIPLSGHAVFLVHSILTTDRVAYRLAAIALLGLTAWFKLVVWHDWVSLALGSIAGGIASVIWTRQTTQQTGLGAPTPGGIGEGN